MPRRDSIDRRYKRHIFLSMPTKLAAAQERLVESLYRQLNRRKLFAQTVGVTKSGKRAPLSQVMDAMSSCHGALILGLVQGRTRIKAKRRATGRRRAFDYIASSSPWNQVEAGIAYALGLPILIVKERGIAGGVFDAGAAPNQFIHYVDVKNPQCWRSTELQSCLDDLNDEVRAHFRDYPGRR